MEKFVLKKSYFIKSYEENINDFYEIEQKVCVALIRKSDVELMELSLEPSSKIKKILGELSRL
jgi:hypothetical protein